MGTGMIWIIFIGIAAVSWLVQMNLQNKFKKYSKIPTGNGMTGADVALKMLHDNGIYDVTVTSKKGYTLPYYVTFVQKLHLTFSSKRTHNQYITVDGATRRESSPSFP